MTEIKKKNMTSKSKKGKSITDIIRILIREDRILYVQKSGFIW